ncbi:MAG TPA: bifunctional glutamate N-acetyltransferase/amino-acid acetyltransferase ArgJ, partial [Roseiflexaceae bacterium]|nr:bifunctional glutamate N-acetyltransferase/amino-acid acetyltransferase ArgJ [Roseiflexaceae bacterium]
KTSSVMGASSLDLALIAADGPCSAAGVFTTNRVKAAPVLLDQQALEQSAGEIRAVIANAGNANAVTGPQGMEDARTMAALVAETLGCRPDQVLVLSTGVIGRPLDMNKIRSGIAEIASPTAHQGAPFVAQAIMTTDTRPKVASRAIEIGGGTVTISGCCKGAGMIHPNMATLLAIVTTDAIVAPDVLRTALQRAVAQSFNRISVDGDTSTNDTLLLLASGASGVEISTAPGDSGAEPDTFAPFSLSASYETFVAALTEVCIELAKQVARDGEGATRLVEIRVTGAASEGQAHQVANSIARSPLVKTAVHGGDPNWGRVLCAAGYSGAAIDPDRISLSFGPADRPGDKYDSPAVQVLADGLPTQYDERAARAALVADPALITLDLGLGDAASTVWTCDLTAEYVSINAHYTT